MKQRIINKEMFLNWRGYLIGIALVALATWLKYLAQPEIIPSRAPILYIASIVPVAIFFGLGPALLVCILSILTFDYFFTVPLYTVTPLDIQDLPLISIFFLVGVVLSFLSANLRSKNKEMKRQLNLLEQAKKEISESENKYRSLVENANEVIAIVQDGAIKFFGGNTLELTGYLPEEAISKSFLEVVFSDDREKARETYEKLLNNGTNSNLEEFRVVRKDGGIGWAQMNAARVLWESRPAVLALFTDVTQRKKAEEALVKSKSDLTLVNEKLKLYGYRITQVQEEERKRIAYELHDDTAQYLGILKMQLGALIDSEKIQSPEIKEKLTYLERDADRAFNEVRRYSHELRPVVLEHQGLVAAIEQIAEDINKLKEFNIEVNTNGSEPELSEEVKLGFFRITQEALNNIRKHAKTTKAFININFTEDQVSIAVIDNGIGFEISQAKANSELKGSLGLMSMKERADLINAKLNIESRLGWGTTVKIEKSLFQ